MNKSSYTLWLPSWYPTRLHPLNGDFIQRHARAVSRHLPVEVIHLIRDAGGAVTKTVHTEQKAAGNLRETIIYYYVHPAWPRPLQPLISYLRYRSAFQQAFEQLRKERGLPCCTHVHVALKAGLLALWLQKKFGVPYLVSEHWSGYLPQAKLNLQSLPRWWKAALAKILKNSTGVSAVSAHLAQNIALRLPVPEPVVIPNVVDTALFRPGQATPGKHPVFLHVSTLDHPKNPEALLEGFALFQQKTGTTFQLRIVGPKREALEAHAAALGLQQVQFFPEMPQPALAQLVQESSALVLFSRYETFGVVLIEAQACGIPVIVSNLPAFAEHVEDGVNGIVAAENTPDGLAEALDRFLSKRHFFDGQKLSSQVHNRYSYEAVGQKFVTWYRSMGLWPPRV